MNLELLSAYLDGELDGSQRQQVEAAIAADPQLAADLQSLSATRELLRGLAEVDPTPGIFEPQKEAIAERTNDRDHDRNVVSLGAERRKRSRRWLAPAALAGVAAVVLLLLGVFSGGGLSTLVPSVDEYASRHTASIALGESDGFVEMDQTDMPDSVVNESMEMMGVYQRDDVVQAVYSDGEHDMSVYAEPGHVDWDGLAATGGTMTHDEGDTAWHSQTDGLGVLVVERDEHVVVVVAPPDMGDDEMLAAANSTF